MIIIGCPGSEQLAKKIARKAKKKYAALFIKKFPDGEVNVRLPGNIKNNVVVFVYSLFHPDEKILELLFAAHTAKDLKAKKIILVAPYLAYLRQDKRFFSGDCISSLVIGKLFNIFDEIITIDPHLHRFHSLSQIFKTKTKKLSANKSIANYIKKNIKNPVIFGPDEESYQWARTIASYIKSHAYVLKKKRYNSRNVKIKIKNKLDLENKAVVIVDDIISTGHTMIETVKESKRQGAKKIYCICVHGIFAEEAYEKLRKLNTNVISTNTISHKTNKIDVSKILAEAL